jgi:hypothetical protein
MLLVLYPHERGVKNLIVFGRTSVVIQLVDVGKLVKARFGHNGVTCKENNQVLCFECFVRQRGGEIPSFNVCLWCARLRRFQVCCVASLEVSGTCLASLIRSEPTER